MLKHLTLFSIAVCLLACAPDLQADDYDTARNNRVVILAGPTSFNTGDPAISAQLASIATVAQGYQSTMETGGGRTELWSDLPFPSGTPNTLSANMTSTYGRLKAMALAYATYGCSLQGSSSLLSSIIDGLTWMNSNVYSSSAKQVGNWWDFQIGTPLGLNDVMVLLYPQLTSTQISTWVGAITHFTPSPIDTGANLMWTSEIVSLSGVLVKSSTQVAKGIASAPTVLNTVTSGDGFYADGSFIQHTSPGFAYTGGYGFSLIDDLVNFTTVYAGTQWALSSSTISTEISILFNSFKPFIYKGEMLSDVMGREIARWSEGSHVVGRDAVATFLHAATNTTGTSVTQLQSAAKYWIQQDTTYSSTTAGFDIRTILQAESVLNNSGITVMSEPTGFRLFSGMDRVVHLRPGWGSSVSMWSARHGDYESINNENLKGWYTGNGMLYVYDSDLNQYSNNYWPTVNNYFQQGTTVLENTTQAAGAKSASSFVGGVPSWDGSYGMAEMRLDPSSGSLTGNKAWFFLDDQIMCLGAAIASSSSTIVRTVVANRQLTAAGTNTSATPLGTSNASPTAEPGVWYTNGSPINWMWIDGNVTGSSYGVFFPTAIELQSMREARTHAWNEINTNANYVNHTTDYTNNYYYSTINHGAAPTGASYAYAVLPTISQSGMSSYASSPEVTVVENDAIAQAISDSKLGVNAAVFWQTATETVGSGSSAITSDSKSAVFVTQSNGNLEISVSDPTQTNTGTVHITLGQNALGLIDSSPNVTVSSLSPIEIAVNVNGLLGQPALARFNLSSGGLVVVDNATNTGGSTVALAGTWTTSTGTAGYYDTNYLEDGNTNKGSDTVTFKPNVSGAGSYDVQIWYTSASNRATNVPVTVNAADGAHAFTVDQTSGGGKWVTLGSFNFNVGTSGTVVISNSGTNGYVVADAVRLIAR